MHTVAVATTANATTVIAATIITVKVMPTSDSDALSGSELTETKAIAHSAYIESTLHLQLHYSVNLTTCHCLQ